VELWENLSAGENTLINVLQKPPFPHAFPLICQHLLEPKKGRLEPDHREFSTGEIAITITTSVLSKGEV
jgi:hypothetical protein